MITLQFDRFAYFSNLMSKFKTTVMVKDPLKSGRINIIEEVKVQIVAEMVVNQIPPSS